MTKLIIQIPCFNEVADLPRTLEAIPRQILGIDKIEILIIDDGSSDGTADLARSLGVEHIVRHRRNRGLAAAFQSGVDACLRAGADIIVNTDADGQYAGEDIATLVRPVLEGQADIVIGDRGVGDNQHFGPIKRRLQQFGSKAVQGMARVEVSDAVSGFRAFSREAAQRLTITTEFSYTTDMLIQAGRKRLSIISVPIRTNETMRPSRLFSSIPKFITNTGITMVRAYTTYNPLRVFVGIGTVLTVLGLLPILRFLYFYIAGEGDGHIQSIVIGGALLVLGAIVAVLGMLADLIAANRKLIETSLTHIRRIEFELSDSREQKKHDAKLERKA